MLDKKLGICFTQLQISLIICSLAPSFIHSARLHCLHHVPVTPLPLEKRALSIHLSTGKCPPNHAGCETLSWAWRYPSYISAVGLVLSDLGSWPVFPSAQGEPSALPNRVCMHVSLSKSSVHKAPLQTWRPQPRSLRDSRTPGEAGHPEGDLEESDRWGSAPGSVHSSALFPSVKAVPGSPGYH